MKKYIPASLAALVLIFSATLLSFIMISLANLAKGDILAGAETEFTAANQN